MIPTNDFHEERAAQGSSQDDSAADIRTAIDGAQEPPLDQSASTDDREARGYELGERDPESGAVVLDPNKTGPTAVALIRDCFSDSNAEPILRVYADVPYVYRGGGYEELECRSIQQVAGPYLHNAKRLVRRNRKDSLVDFDSNPRTQNAAIEELFTRLHVPKSITLPIWTSDAASKPPAHECLAFPNGILHVPTGRLIPATPHFFTLNCVGYDYVPAAPPPRRLLRLMVQLFEDNQKIIGLLQEYFGLCFLPITKYQKALYLYGPPRAGKGVLLRLLRYLVGEANSVATSISSLASDFGLHPLVGKLVALVSDARFVGQSIQRVVELLLSVTGEDAVPVNRKGRDILTMRLPTRFVFAANELPKFADASGALAKRFLIVRFEKSFYGQEDSGLTDELIAEAPSIANWALEGWRRLNERGRFDEPEDAVDTRAELENLSSPVGAFVRERCVVSGMVRVDVDVLYESWKAWYEDEGGMQVIPKNHFSQQLHAVAPSVRTRKTERRGKDVRYFDGIALRPEPTPGASIGAPGASTARHPAYAEGCEGGGAAGLDASAGDPPAHPGASRRMDGASTYAGADRPKHQSEESSPCIGTGDTGCAGMRRDEAGCYACIRPHADAAGEARRRRLEDAFDGKCADSEEVTL